MLEETIYERGTTFYESSNRTGINTHTHDEKHSNDTHETYDNLDWNFTPRKRGREPPKYSLRDLQG